MIKVLVIATLFSACLARPAEEPVPILYSENVVEHDGSFHYSYESGDGTKVNEAGSLKSVGDKVVEAVSGEYSYTSPNGEPIVVQYVADENGFQPQGAHIHPIPESIARAIKWNQEHPAVETIRGKTLVQN